MQSLEAEIAEWRRFVGRSPGVDARSVVELEGHLRDQIADLHAAGLAADEAFLVAVKRMGNLDALSLEFAREYSGRLWRQLVLSDEDDDEAGADWIGALLFAVAAAVTVQAGRLAAELPAGVSSWLPRNAGLLVLPFLAGYFAHRRRLHLRPWLVLAAAFVSAAIVINLYPYDDESSTELLVSTHLPVALWFLVAYPYMSGVVRAHERRMDFVRFTGEWAIYYALIALAGGVLVALTMLIVEPTGVANEDQVIEWMLPTGAAGAVVVTAWLVESKQQVVENMAPVLTMLFTPLFAAMLAGASVIYASTGFGGAFDRELLGVFDSLMVVVVGLVLYGMSARDPSQPAGWTDRIQLVAVAAALVLDAMVLVSMASRIGDLGLTPNRVAALGLNLVLLVNLVGTAWHLAHFLAGRSPYHRLELWQAAYLPVFAAWAVVVVVVLPPSFAFA